MSCASTGPIWRPLIPVASALLLISCTSLQEPSPDIASATEAAVDSHRQWTESTRTIADYLMQEAQRLRVEGNEEGAVARADDAICIVLDTPAGYSPDVLYLDYLAELVEEADEIEASVHRYVDEPEDTEEFVLLPPIDLFVDEVTTAEPVVESPLPASDFPLELNSTVERFIEAMISSGEYNRRIELGLARAGTYLPMIRSMFAEAGLPVDLSYLPLIESAFSVRAYSRARAHGMWQFISSTGRHYGLSVSSLIDERRDPELSTEAAIAYLSDLHGQFDDWYLALAAYNSGSGNVRRAIRRSGSRDFWSLRRYLPRETRNYVPAFIASVIVAKQPEKYGFTPIAEKPWDFETLEVPDALDLQFLAEKSGISVDELRELNPAIRRDLTPARSTTKLRLPPGTTAAAATALESTPRERWAPRMIHTVRGGDSLYAIARRYDSSVGAIRQANALRGNLIKPGQNLIVPRFGTEVAAKSRRPQRTADGGSYVVRKYDTLWDIARGFSISVDSLCSANGLSRFDIIIPGQRLSIPSGVSISTVEPRREPEPDNGATYEVRTGDTLYDIARDNNVSVSALKRINGLKTSRIYPGKVLRIPEPVESSAPSRSLAEAGTYQVKKGDTLYDIARRFGVSISELRRTNGLRSSRIYPGDVLRIPTSQAKG